VVFHADVTDVDVNSSSGKLSRNPNILKSVVFVARPTEVLINPKVSQFSDVRESSNLATFWCNLLELHNSNNLNNLTSAAWTNPEYRYPSLPISVLHPGLQLGHLDSYWEPEPALIRSVLDSPTKLKLISCYYDNDSDNFLNFCENHPLLEVLKLSTWAGYGAGIKQSAWNNDSWKNLSRLKILSLGAELIGIKKFKTQFFLRVCSNSISTFIQGTIYHIYHLSSKVAHSSRSWRLSVFAIIAFILLKKS